MKDSISVIICAYNEEKSIQTAINNVLLTVAKEVSDYEIVVVNDGSTDKTREIAEKTAGKNRKIRVFSHQGNRGFGRAYRTGIGAATKNYIAGYPGDADFPVRFFRDVISKRHKADLISGYMTNMGERSPARIAFSLLFINLMNLLFGLRLRYYNSYFIARADLMKNLPLKSEGFTLFAEIKIRLLKKGVKFYEVPFMYAPRKYGASKALNRKSLFQGLKIIPVLLKDIYFS